MRARPFCLSRVRWPVLVCLSALTLGACSQSDLSSAVQDAPIGSSRNQGSDGACWLYAYSTVLNSFLRRAATESTGALRKYPFLLFSGSQGKPGDNLHSILSHLVASGEMSNSPAIVVRTRLNGVPLISIRGTVYMSYLKRYLRWHGVAREQRTFPDNGGSSADFNELYRLGLPSTSLVADKDPPKDFSFNARFQQIGVEMATTYFQLGMRVPDRTALEAKFIGSSIEKPMGVPPSQGVYVKGEVDLASPLLLPSLAAEHQSWMRAYGMPERIQFVDWTNANLVQGSPDYRAYRGFRRLWAASGLAYPDAGEMAEIVAALSVLNIPTVLSVWRFKVDRAKKEATSTLLPRNGHVMVSRAFEVDKGALRLSLANSWSDLPFLSFDDFDGSSWDVSLPASVWGRLVRIGQILKAPACQRDPETSALAAAFNFLRYKGYSRKSELAVALAAQMERCGEKP